MKLFSNCCKACNAVFTSKKVTSKYCSRPCMWSQNGKHQKRQDSWWINSKGYVEGRVLLGDGRVKRVKQHRYFYERFYGIELNREDDIHHINGIKTDNRIENLERIPHGEHTKHHNERRNYASGYKLKLTDEERLLRAERIRNSKAWEIGLPKANAARLALSKALGEKNE